MVVKNWAGNHQSFQECQGCLNSGFCGMGCPTDAKQGMLVTYIPDALRKGLRLYTDVRATRFESSLEQVGHMQLYGIQRKNALHPKH